MADILELLLSVTVEIVSAVKFKNPRVRRWIITVIFALLGGTVFGTCAWGAVTLLREGSIAGAIVMSVIALAVAIVALIIIIRGHKRNWE